MPHHLLVKATLFLAIGALAMRGAKPSNASLLLAAVLALSLCGLPLTGGALAKLALKAEFAGGSEAMLATLSSIGTALSMTHFLIHLALSLPGAAQECSGRLIFFWALLRSARSRCRGLFIRQSTMFQMGWDSAKLLDRLWPVALGVGLALVLRRIDWSLPYVPADDSIVLEEGAFHRF